MEDCRGRKVDSIGIVVVPRINAALLDTKYVPMENGGFLFDNIYYFDLVNCDPEVGYAGINSIFRAWC